MLQNKYCSLHIYYDDKIAAVSEAWYDRTKLDKLMFAGKVVVCLRHAILPLRIICATVQLAGRATVNTDVTIPIACHVPRPTVKQVTRVTSHMRGRKSIFVDSNTAVVRLLCSVPDILQIFHTF